MAAARKEAGQRDELTEEDVEKDLVLLGLFGLIDPPRQEAINALVMSQIFYLLNVRVYRQPAYTLEGLFGSRVVLLAMAACAVLQVLFTHLPFMNALFGTAPLDAWAWAQCIAVGVGIFIIVEIEKAIRRHSSMLAAEGLRARGG